MTRAAHRMGPGVRGAGRACIALACAAAVLATAAPAFAADTYTVTGTSDSMGGSCSALVCTNLRAAVTAANADPGSTVDLGAGQFQLSDGELAISADMAIQGQGASQTTIEQTDGIDRVIEVTTASTVAIMGVTITGGTVVGTAGSSPGANGELEIYGGGIASDGSGSLTLMDDTIRDNSVTGGAGGGNSGTGTGGGGGFGLGGGIYSHGTLTIVDTTVAGNTATGGMGGTTTGTGAGGASSSGEGAGIFEVGALTVRSSTISGNGAAAGAPGTSTGGGAPGAAGKAFAGAIDDQQAAGSIVNSTIANNTAATLGGSAAVAGLGTASSGTPLALASDTFAGNAASGATLNVANIYTGLSSLTIADTMLVAGGGTNCDFTGSTTDDSHNLEDDAGASCGFSGANHDLVGVDPALDQLASNGGPTQTMALAAGSPAIGGGGQCTDPTNGGAALHTDQRGEPRHNPCDIGAFEHQPPALTAAPAVSGGDESGDAESCSAGRFSGDQPLIYVYQWLRDGAPIAGARSSSYEATTADVGHQLACRVTATNAYGSASGTSAPVAITARAVMPAPKISRLKQTHKRWREGTKLASIARRGIPVGDMFTFRLNTGAKLTLTFTPKVGRHKVTKSLKFIGHAGADKIFFDGRLSRSKRLKPGRYELVIVATNSAGQSSPPRRLAFTIV